MSRNEAVEYIAHLLLKRAAQYERAGDYAYCSGDAGIDREAAALLLAGDELAQRVTHTLQEAGFDEWIARELPRATGFEIDLCRTVWLAARTSRTGDHDG